MRLSEYIKMLQNVLNENEGQDFEVCDSVYGPFSWRPAIPEVYTCNSQDEVGDGVELDETYYLFD